jgi:hypothetical protein
VSARIEFGYEFVDVNKSVNTFGKDQDWFGTGTIDWRPTERQTAAIRIEHDTTFATRGETVVRTFVDVTFSQDITGGFNLLLHGRVGTADYDSVDSARNDDISQAGVQLSYKFTGRFSASVGTDWLSNQSNFELNNFDRSQAFTRVRVTF